MRHQTAIVRFQRLFRPIVFKITTRHHSRRIFQKVRETFPNLVIDSSSLIIDLGSNRGRFTKAFADTGARIIAIEPNPHVFASTVKHMLKYKNLEFLQAAVVDRPAKLDLYFHKDNHIDPVGFSISASLKQNKANISQEHSRPVVTIEFDSLMKNFSSVSLMKIDIEGGEIDLFDSIIKNKEKIKYLLVETHLDRVPGGIEEFSRMQKFILANKLSNNWSLEWE
jgi:FkbM family methyltransferase